MINTPARSLPHRAFSLVEMLVVIAIIALLLAALLPAFSSVRTSARVAATQAQYNALNSGIATYRNEQSLGGGLPPSSSDRVQAGDQGDRNLIANPGRDANRNGGAADVRIAGAHLLVQAMIGADGLGTPGFKDVNRDPNRIWSDDTHDQEQGQTAGLYYIDPNTGATAHPRYGGGGYVDEKMREKTVSLQQLFEEAKLVNPVPDSIGGLAYDEPLFLDAWDRPILYYKANPSSIRMTGSNEGAGIYWQEDNAVITGSGGGVLGSVPGMDFGAGADPEHPDEVHLIHDTEPPPAAGAPDLVEQVAETNAAYEHTFARYIIDPSIKARPTPVQKSEYLLISAGPDGVYGSDDDVTNWTRKTE